MKGLIVKDGFKWALGDDAAREAFAKFKQGDELLVDFKRNRNIQHHRKLFALLKIAVDNSDAYASVDTLLDAIKIDTGYADVGMIKLRRDRWAGMLDKFLALFREHDIPEPTYAIVIKPQSISFASMSQDKFEPFYDAAVQFVIREVLPGIDRADLELEVLSSF